MTDKCVIKELKEQRYCDWVKGGMALKHLKDGFVDFANAVVEQEHTKMMESVLRSAKQSCNQCDLKSIRPLHASSHKVKNCQFSQTYCNCLRPQTRKCPNNICDVLYDKILTCHGSARPFWKNTDIHKWTSSPWEVAKCFINVPVNAAIHDAKDVDVTSLLHLFVNNIAFQSHLKCPIDLLDKIREWRNTLFHSPSMTLEESHLKDGVNDIISLLQDEKEIVSMRNSQNAVLNLSNLLKDGFVITPETEETICRAATVALHEKEEELKRTINEASEKIQKEVDQVEHLAEEIAAKVTGGLHCDINALKERVDRLELGQILNTESIRSLRETVRGLEKNEQALTAQKEEHEAHCRKIGNRRELRKNLTKLYDRHYVKASVSPLKARDNVIEIKDVYVQPVLTKELNDPTFTGNIVQEEVESYKTIFENDGEPINRIYIVVDVGSGKSSFCKMMISRWSSSVNEQNGVDEDGDIRCPSVESLNNRAMRQFDFLFYVPLQGLQSNGNLKEMICRLYKNYAPSNVLIEIFDNVPERCLIIADGLDEWVPDQCSLSLPHQTYGLPDTDNVKSATVLITSRPSSPGLLNMKSSEYDSKFMLYGIDKHSVDVLAEKYISKQTPKLSPQEILQQLHSSEIQHLERTPLLLQHVVWLLCNDFKAGKSTSEIYSSLINIAMRWDDKKHESNTNIKMPHRDASVFRNLSLPDLFDDYPTCESHRDVIFAVSKIAAEILLQKSNKLFGRSKLHANGFDDALINAILQTGLLNEENRYDPTAEDTQFVFTHTAIEYFAALYLACHVNRTIRSTESYEDLLPTLLGNDRSVVELLQLDNVLILTCGLAPIMTQYVIRYVYEICQKDKEFVGIRTSYNTQIISRSIKVSNEYRILTKQCQKLVSHCVFESRLRDPSVRLQVPISDVVIDYDYTSYKYLIMDVVDPKAVHYLVVKDVFQSQPVHGLEELLTFKNLQSLSLEWFSLSQAQIASLASFITQTTTLQNICLADLSNPGLRRKHPCCEEINLRNHHHLRSISVSSRLLRIHNINASELEQCLLDGARITFAKQDFSTKLRHLIISYAPLNHEELSNLTKLMTYSVALKSIRIMGISCLDHEVGTRQHVLDLSEYSELDTLDITENESIHCKNVNTRKLTLCTTDRKDIIQCLRYSNSLTELDLRDIRYSSDDNDIILTIKNLQTLKLRWIEIEEGALFASSKLECLTYVKLKYAKICLVSWKKFVESLLELRQSVTVKRTWPPLTKKTLKRSVSPKQPPSSKLRQSLSMEHDEAEADARAFVANQTDKFEVLEFAKFDIPTDLSSFQFKTMKKWLTNEKSVKQMKEME